MSEPHDGVAGPAPGPADYAFACVGASVAGGRAPEPPEDAFYERRAACFVTLKKHGELRGCIGTLEPAESVTGLGDRPQRPLVGDARPSLSAGDRRRARGPHLLGRRPRPQ